ncbi:hypothetical protein FDA94_37325 [Herbidospora galbida]|uniref:Uncharacterized protein n=1 Tax=Herbidospora galbida TaxID=2575442 RepID=A0A4U3LU60_9ACTN|nr:hypothetical protein [Herbidospora galbida]TKK78744.1 hypothetical protein FDA94_37325 [Herbidospora galbida]
MTATITPKGGAAVPLKLDKADVPTITTSKKYVGTYQFGRGEAAGDWTLAIKAGNASGTTEASKGFRVVQVWSTDIVRFGAGPEPARFGSALTVSGRLLILGPKGPDGLKDQRVKILFKERGSFRWKTVAWDRTNWRGDFAVRVKALKSGWWKAEYDGVRGFTHGSSSGSDQVTVFRPRPPKPDAASRVVDFNASPEPVKKGKKLSLVGELQTWDHGRWDGYEGKVTVWFKAKSGKWTYVKTAWTDGSGEFSTTATAKKTGDWRVVFAGDKDTKPSNSKSDWVLVK